MKKLMFISVIVMFSQNVFSKTICPADLVENVQIERDVVLYKQSDVWRRLGVLTDIGTKERFSALLAAHMAGKKVGVGYPKSDYDCSKTNYVDSSNIVRTYN
ncbi:hypothetical protein KO763_002916 [Vibrio parahaemolyticus]|nr:hypothetical protein [Vibrio parahaemolyticus]